MDKQYICYCGLYCENCAVKARIDPAAKLLYREMKAAGFEEIIDMIPGGAGFWPFLKDMAENGTCMSCREGSGDPGCAIRICAKEKGVEMCAECKDYPCGHIEEFYRGHSFVKKDNDMVREKGQEAWFKLQDERMSEGFVYRAEK
ncbi:hypothetical protein SDC9_32826 [bioreactor metagenome]|uniref:DUF3795 domain-containing protein n=1 Tax=bioreactor metagenome TaxID=1076179 RepID=A0A644V671_9ZZZZ|nr:DUF3795 domain-containing protein [Methanocorpusculum sp.]